MKVTFSRRAFVTQMLSAIGLTLSKPSSTVAAPLQACRPDVKGPEAFAALVKSTPIIDIHCHIFNATDIPAYQFLEKVVSLKTFSDAYLSRAKKDSIYQLKDGEWKKFYKDSEREFGNILELIREHDFLDNSYPLDRLLLTPSYAQEKALLDDLAATDGKYDDIEAKFIRAIVKQHAAGDNSAYARNWFRYSSVDWRGPRKVTDEEIAAVARRIRVQNKKFKTGIKQLRGLKRFLACIVHSRVENFLALRETYEVEGVEGGSPVKLFTPALVDFDYWLAGPDARAAAAETPTLIEGKGMQHARLNEGTTIRRKRASLRQQVEMMGQLSKLFPAECHSYFPFCPWRQVDIAATGKLAETPLELLKLAIKDHGFIGVKVYPPMGFRPWHNAMIARHASLQYQMFPAHLYDRKRFPYLPEKKPGQSVQDWQFAASEDFGKRLDAALADLYKFCVANNVPIMTHAGPSNFSGGYDVFEDGSLKHNFYSEKGAIAYWHKMISDPATGCAGLRLNLAHAGFGNEEWGKQLILALSDNNQIYADISYFEKILSGPKGDTCKDAEEDGEKLRLAIARNEGIAKRFMYGSDWYMMAQEDFSENYLDVFSKVLRNHVKDDRTFKAVMAGNASRFLGLTLKENSNYERLIAFYDRSFGAASRKASEAKAKLDRLAEIGEETA